MTEQLIEGSRSFNIAYGTITALISLALAFPVLLWWLPEHRRSFFGTAIDPSYKLQLGYGLFCMAMMGTNLGCRYIPHGHLAYVHATFAIITFALTIALTPRILYMLVTRPRTVTV